MTWWLSPVAVTDDGPRLERAHGDWVWPQAQGRLGAALQQIGANGRYELIGLLNRGGQAYLWAARDHATNDALVVIKTVNPRSGDPVDSARLTREARLLELLAGEPTVMSILDWGPGRLRCLDHGEFETDRPWLVLPYRAHLSLDRALALSGGRLSADAVWRIGLDLGAALKHLHQAQVVHRDLSLRNVLLTPTGCVLADLGMAWAASMVDQTVEQRFTTGITNQSRGVTWGWLAPEAARPPQDERRRDRDPAVDIFGWGLHVFGAATGRHPWAATGLQPNEDELYAMYDQGVEASLVGLDRSDLPTAFRDVVTAALCTDPGGRPTATEVLAALGPRPSEQAATATRAVAARSQAAEPAAVSTSSAAHGSGALHPTAPAGVGSRTRLVAGVLALVTALAIVGVSGYRTSQQIQDAEQARAIAAAFPVALRTQAALYTEFTFPVSGSAALRTKGRAATDRLIAELTADLSGLKQDAAAANQEALPVAFHKLLEPLPNLRVMVDRRAKTANKNQVAALAVAQAFIASASATMVNQAQVITRRLADAMDVYASDNAARDQVDVARAAAEAGVANATLEVLGTSVINKQQSMTNDRFGLMTELVQQQRVQLGIAQGHADGATTTALLAVTNTDAIFYQWTIAMQSALNNDLVAIGDETAYRRFMDDRLASVHSLATIAAQSYQADAQKSLQHSKIRLAVELGIGALLLILVGLAVWWRRRRVRTGSPHSGGETATVINAQELTRQQVTVGTAGV